jgi:hypothetical protein
MSRPRGYVLRFLSRKRTYILAFWLVAGFGVASSHNACSKAVFTQSFSSLLQEIQSTALVLINKDAQYTNSDQVEVNLESKHAEEVYVTNDPSCNAGGAWEPMTSAKNWTLGLKNQETIVYAKFRNKNEGLETGCINDAIVHDDEAPVVSLQTPSIVTNVNTPIFYFLAGDTLSGLDKTTCEWPGQSETQCNFSSSNGNVIEGRHLVKVRATDLAGNVSAPVLQDLLVDRTKPTVTLLNVPASISNVTSVNVTFAAQDNLSGIKNTECSWNNGATYAACASPLSANLAEGAHKLLVRSMDKAGNQGDAVEHSFAIDLTAPTVNILTGPDAFTNSTTAAFTFNGFDGTSPITVFECRVDANAFASCSSGQAYTGLAEGLRKFEVRGRDMSGNLSAPASRSWVIDTTAPVITLIQTPSSPTKLTSAEYRYTISDSSSGVDRAECSIDGAALQACALDMKSYAGLAAGSHTFKIKAYDHADSRPGLAVE